MGTGTDQNNYGLSFHLNSIGGEYTHTLTINEIPSHYHTAMSGSLLQDGVSGASATYYRGINGDALMFPAPQTANTGGSQSHNNLQPYVVVSIWKRIE